jgi:hypothetical protein
MNPSYPYDPELHEPGSVAATGRCSWHGWDGRTVESCGGEAVVSFQDRDGTWQSGCAVALRELVERGEIEPLGQGA